MGTPPGIAVCWKRLNAEETLQFRLNMSVQRVPLLIRGSAHGAGVLPHISYTKQSARHSLNVQYGSETHLREVPIYVKSRIVTS